MLNIIEKVDFKSLGIAEISLISNPLSVKYRIQTIDREYHYFENYIDMENFIYLRLRKNKIYKIINKIKSSKNLF